MMILLLLISISDYNPSTLIVPPFQHSMGFYRASKYYLNLYLGPHFNYDDPQGIAAVKLDELDNPKTHRDDDELTIFAVNSGSGEIVYNVSFEAIKVFKKDFAKPKGIAALPSGLVYMADFGNNRVIKLRYHKGNMRIEGIIADNLDRPYGVALDSKGNLYVTDMNHAMIKVFGLNDSLKIAFGQQGKAKGELYYPTAIAVIDDGDQFNFYKDNFLAVTDLEGQRLQIFSLSGKFLKAVTVADIGLTEARFSYLAIDRYGNIYVTDSLNNQIHKFDHNLRYIISYGRSGVKEGEFISPRGLTIWRKYGQVFISEKEGGQYLWLGVDALLIGCFPEEFVPGEKGTTIALYLTEMGDIKIFINKITGGMVRHLISVPRQPPGDFLVLWDGRDNEGKAVPSGIYEVQVMLRATYGSRYYFRKQLTTRVKCISES